ncbi:MAG TPA: HipA domain-containing protein [Candidatus Lustribacter sp.]
MPAALAVWLNRDRVGTLSNLSGDYNLFSFDEAYLANESRPVLSQAFLGTFGNPLAIIPRTHRVAPPFFANLLPEEGGALRNIVAGQFAINKTRDYPYLRALGQDLPGAIILRELTPDEPEEVVPLDGPRSTDRPLRFSLAGVQPKFSASFAANRLTMSATGRGGNWIAKLPTNAYQNLPENEYRIMSLARAIGLPVPETHLIDLSSLDGIPESLLPVLRPEESRSVYIISRFDRTASAARIHVEDFNQIADQAPADKYEHRTSQWIANVITALCPQEDVENYVRRLVFGVCIGNNDMHLKNWAICYPDGRNPRLAPMYDFVCTRYYYPTADLALTIGGTRSFEAIDLEAIARFATGAEISAKRAQILARETVESIRGAWPGIKSTMTHPPMIAAIERHFSTVPLMQLRR